MPNPFSDAAFRPDAAFAGAAERFFELMKSFGPAGAGGATAAPDWPALAGSLAGQFEQWLRSSVPGMGAAIPGIGAGLSSAAGSFGPLPLGAGAAPQQDAQRTWDLVARLAQLQAQLASYWSEIARGAAQQFVARLPGALGGGANLDNALKLYELWVNCAEESYAATVRKEEFCHLQAQLANTSAALLVEQRRHAETLMRAFGLPNRSEVDALYAQLKELRAQLEALAGAGRARAGSGNASSKRAAASQASTGSGQGRRRRRARKPRA